MKPTDETIQSEIESESGIREIEALVGDIELHYILQCLCYFVYPLYLYTYRFIQGLSPVRHSR